MTKSDEQIRQELTRLNELLGQLEETPGPAGEIAREALSALTRVYGEALARALGYVADAGQRRAAFLGDELLGHLLVLHDMHPEPVGDRVARALREISEAVGDRGGRVELIGIENGVAAVRLTKRGCGSSMAGIDEVLREEVLALAPELADVKVVTGAAHHAAQEAAFVPLDKLTVRPPTAGTRS